MRYAVFSDIHGNLPAFKAVLEDARRREADRFIIAGDYCLSGPYPGECIKTLRDLEPKTIIRGNEEQYLKDRIGEDQSTWTNGQMQISYWAFRNIARDDLDYLLALSEREDIKDGGVDIHIAHRSDAFIGDIEFNRWGPVAVAEKFGSSGAQEGEITEKIRLICDADEDFQKACSALADGVYIFGHTHVQWDYKVKDRKVYLVNPGSCGLPVDLVRDTVPYTILQISDAGEVSIEPVRVPFDKEAYIGELKATSQYKEARVWSDVIIHEQREAKEYLTSFLRFTKAYAESIGDEERPFSVPTWEKAYELWEESLK